MWASVRPAGGVPEDEEAELHAVDLDSSRESTGTHGHAQYLSANCVVFTHYSGDAAAVVDEHFSRALAYADSKAAAPGKGRYSHWQWWHWKKTTTGSGPKPKNQGRKKIKNGRYWHWQ